MSDSSESIPNDRSSKNGNGNARDRLLAALNERCFVCGPQNPKGLRLSFAVTESGSTAQWVPKEGWESFQGVIHGGVVSAVLDEAMSKAIISKGYEALTAELKIRFRKKISVDEKLCVRGWMISVQKRKILAEASLTNLDGVEKAHAWGAFVVVRALEPEQQIVGMEEIT